MYSSELELLASLTTLVKRVQRYCGFKLMQIHIRTLVSSQVSSFLAGLE